MGVIASISSNPSAKSARTVGMGEKNHLIVRVHTNFLRRRPSGPTLAGK